MKNIKITKEMMKDFIQPSVIPTREELIKEALDSFPLLLMKTYYFIIAATAVATYDKHDVYNKWLYFITWVYEQEAMELPELPSELLSTVMSKANDLNMLGLIVTVDEERIESNLSKIAVIILKLKECYGEQKYKKAIESYIIQRERLSS